ncbi:MAG: CPBP family intramembrane glutamic endopeptidase [Verrucomicrobiota bacterium]|jgi:membrane protease YdiL (CAAX protease family)
MNWLSHPPRLHARHWRLEWVTMLVVGILVATMMAGILGQLLLDGTSAGSGPHATFLRLLMGLLGLQVSGLGLIHVFLRQHGYGWASGFGLRLEPRAMAWGVAMAAASVLVAYPMEEGIVWLLKAAGRTPEPQASVRFLQSAPAWQQALIGLLAVVPAALVEEALFRGVLYSAGRDAGYRRLALVGSSLLFGLAHGHVPTLLPLTLFGAALAWTYERTGSLLACCIAHAGFNMVGLMVAITGMGLPKPG